MIDDRGGGVEEAALHSGRSDWLRQFKYGDVAAVGIGGRDRKYSDPGFSHINYVIFLLLSLDSILTIGRQCAGARAFGRRGAHQNAQVFVEAAPIVSLDVRQFAAGASRSLSGGRECRFRRGIVQLLLFSPARASRIVFIFSELKYCARFRGRPFNMSV